MIWYHLGRLQDGPERPTLSSIGSDVSGWLSAMPFWHLLSLITILGLIWGSFVGTLCSRWPKGESVANGRSRCDNCEKVIAGYDLVSLVSYLVLRGKCRNCGRKIGVEIFAIELVAASIGAICALMFPESQALAAAIFCWLLLPLAILDYSHLWLPNRLVLLLAVIGMLIGPILLPSAMLVDRILAASVGFLCIETIRLAYKKFRGHEGLGAGDPKLFAALGVWLGWEALPLTLLLASIIGLLIALITRQSYNSLRTAFPLGSYLAVAAVAVSRIEMSKLSV